MICFSVSNSGRSDVQRNASPCGGVYQTDMNSVSVKLVLHDAFLLATLQDSLRGNYSKLLLFIFCPRESFLLSSLWRALELVYWDLPFGLGLADWDQKALTPEDFSNLFNQLAIVNTAPDHVIVLLCHYKETSVTVEAMTAAGYQNIHPVYHYKPAQNGEGMNFIFAVECSLIGYKRSQAQCKLRFAEMNPVFRHNLLFSPNVRAKAVVPGESDQEPVNTTQKHPLIASQVAAICCQPGDTALVLGFGSGSEVLGMAHAGINVVGIEKDPRQFRGTVARLDSILAGEGGELKYFANLNQERRRFEDIKGAIAGVLSPASRSSSSLSSASAADQNPPVDSKVAGDEVCDSCGNSEPVPTGPLLDCALASCGGRFHNACALRCSEDKAWCSQVCLHATSGSEQAD